MARNKDDPAAAAPPTAKAARPTFQRVPTALVDDPGIAMRRVFDEDKLHELMADIQARGVLQPVGLVRSGQRFRLVWGHRRTVAARALQLPELPAMVFLEGTPDEEAMKYSENAIREDVKAADEAEYFNQLLIERCGEDVDKLAAMVGRSREFVEGRLLLLRGDGEVFAALQAGDISLGVAEWLNRCKDPINRKVFLDSAIKSGATVAAMREWVQRANQFQELQEAGPQGPVPLTPPPGAAPVHEIRCHFCNEGMDVGPLITIYAHQLCERIFRRRLEEQQWRGSDDRNFTIRDEER